MSRLCPLFSSSSGNSTYISSGGCSVIVDAGASFKGICAALEAAGSDLSDLRAVAVTHTHTDHTKGLKTLLKKTGLPLVASSQTLETLVSEGLVPPETTVLEIGDGPIQIGGLQITRFATSHDSEGSSGFAVDFSDGKRAAVCTDLGIVTDGVRAALSGCQAVLFESNHDIEMLKRGPYPPQLKLRIMSDKGHLSNSACAVELPRLLECGCTRFVLGHLSQHNNLPTLARSASRAVLTAAGAAEGSDYILSVAKPTGNGVTVF